MLTSCRDAACRRVSTWRLVMCVGGSLTYLEKDWLSWVAMLNPMFAPSSVCFEEGVFWRVKVELWWIIMCMWRSFWRLFKFPALTTFHQNNIMIVDWFGRSYYLLTVKPIFRKAHLIWCWPRAMSWPVKGSMHQDKCCVFYDFSKDLSANLIFSINTFIWDVLSRRE